MSQHMDALAIAERNRLAASNWRHAVEAKSRNEGLLELVDVLRERSAAAPESLPLMRFLSSPIRVGPAKAAAVMSAAHLPPQRVRLRDLTERERRRLASVLEDSAGIRECLACGERFVAPNGRATCSSGCEREWRRRLA